MEGILKPHIHKQLEEIKRLLISKQSFAPALYRLYGHLAQNGRHAQIISCYRFALLYADKQQKEQLLHPYLLQAFLAEGQLRQAKCLARRLLNQNPADKETSKLINGLKIRQESTLPAFTAVAAVSAYAVKTPRKTKQQAVPPLWRQAQTLFDAKNLEVIGYFATRQKLARFSRTYKNTLCEIFDELTASYLLQNYRAVAVLSGALLELLLARHLEQKLHKKKLSAAGRKPQNIYELNLNDLIELCTRHGLLNAHLLRLTRVARAQRNFIHPGKEVTSQTVLTPAGARICFLTIREIADAL